VQTEQRGGLSSTLRQVLLGLGIMGLLACVVVGSTVLTLEEGRVRRVAQPTATPTFWLAILPTSTLPPPPTTTNTPTSTATAMPTATTAAEEPTPVPPTATYTPPPTPTRAPTKPPLPTATRVCRVPAGWRVYVIRRGDTLSGLARFYRTTVQAIVDANCLSSYNIRAGDSLYLPAPPPTATPTATPRATVCQPAPPEGWVIYQVQATDTLYSLALARDTTVDRIRSVNCLTGPEPAAGDRIYLPPPPPTATPTWTYVPSTTPTASATSTVTPGTPTTEPTATQTIEPTATETATVEPTATLPPTPTEAATVEPTPTETATTVPIPTETPTVDPTPTYTPTPVPGN
jgi:LysM repeat protein